MRVGAKKKLLVKCDFCGKEMYRCPSHIHRHNFCSRQCLADYSSKSRNPKGYDTLKDYTNISATFTRINKEMNKSRMTGDVRAKLRLARLNSGAGVTYPKYYGRHEHRVIAERILGRPLKDGEVVHHIDGDVRNNALENLRIFASQAEHARFHAELNAVLKMINS